MLAVIILAAGGGTRMKSSLPKVLHSVCGKPMLSLVLATGRELEPENLIVVLGHENEVVTKTLQSENFDVAYQVEQLGTAHAVKQAAEKLKGFKGDIVILYGDAPLVTKQTIKSLIDKRRSENTSVAIATTELSDPAGYGRVIRSESGGLDVIVEDKDCDENQRLVKEINTGIYCFDSEALFYNLNQVTNNNSQNEYYLTDVVGLLVGEGKMVSIVKIDADESTGVNSRKDLALVNKICRRRINDSLMLKGVTITDPNNTYISLDVNIEADCQILPGTTINGKTEIKAGCIIGPNTYIDSCEINENAKIVSSHLQETIVGKNAVIGPFSHLRPGTVVGENAKIGSFTETKKTIVGKNSKVPHLSYVGDTNIGENVNIGAGTITCNYDGKNKHETIIEDGAFIGSDTMLVAPIKVGKNSVTGAGSVLTQDVPEDSLAVERSGQKHIKGWTKRKRGK
jgi:bifunctional UDP-N-acetylglucosamine pyrophosphorylase/glucosamine-1-phosphate N-acetyltransferase